jgi:DNA-binding transcriptional regulator YiaG
MAAAIHGKAGARKQDRAKVKAPRLTKTAASSVKAGMVVDLRKRLELKQAMFARLLPVSVRSLATLEAGVPPTEAVARRLTELRRLTNALAEVMKKESLGRWLQTPNEAFDGLKPLEVIDRGESDRIWSMIYFLRSGAPS